MTPEPSTGIPTIDNVLTRILPGDNIVWQVDSLEHYRHLSQAFASRAISDGHRTVYLRFASHPPILEPDDALLWIDLDPSVGFDAFTRDVRSLVSRMGKDAFYVFDNISMLVADWKTDESLANFFRVTCPHLADLDTVAYFALSRGQHQDAAIAHIRDTTQILVDVLDLDGQIILHPVKAVERYSTTMFLPHLYVGDTCVPVFESAKAAELLQALRTQPLRTESGAAPWDRLYARVQQLADSGADLTAAYAPELAALRDDLARMVLGSRREQLDLIRRYITLDDLLKIKDRLIGTGRIGGKAAGMILARKALEQDSALALSLEPHDSFYIASDVYFGYLVANDLFQLRLRPDTSQSDIEAGYPEVLRQFLQGEFAPDITAQFSRMLEYFGQAPIIVRSSSLLEDDVGSAFAGKYESIFCPNQGHLPDRLAAFTDAVKQVYASALSPDALAYRRKHDLLDSDEQMAILVQRVAGSARGRYFYPDVAGVGFSQSAFIPSGRIDPAAGMLRLVVGLGTRAVDRVGGDYPRSVFLSHPSWRPEIDAASISKYSQHRTDVIDTAANRFTTLAARNLADPSTNASWDLLYSLAKDDSISDPVSRIAPATGASPIVTFSRLLSQTGFADLMREVLSRLESAWGQPVDAEFTASISPERRVRVNLLQCRPLRLPGASGAVTIPEIDSGRVLFRSSDSLWGGACSDISLILYIDPASFETLPLDRKQHLGRVVGAVANSDMAARHALMLIGPGRWGSSNIELGVNVTYADIAGARALVELSRASAGHAPELSYGTHFFQDLVEDEVLYVPVFPEREASLLNEAFFAGSPNCLADARPELAGWADVLKLIDVAEASGGSLATLLLDPLSRTGICFLS